MATHGPRHLRDGCRIPRHFRVFQTSDQPAATQKRHLFHLRRPGRDLMMGTDSFQAEGDRMPKLHSGCRTVCHQSSLLAAAFCSNTCQLL